MPHHSESLSDKPKHPSFSMLLKPIDPNPLARGVVILHKYLIGAGGAERLAIEEYRYFSKCRVPTKLIAFQADPKAIFGLNIDDIEVISVKGTINGVILLRQRLLELNPSLIIVSGGLRDFFLANLLLDIPYIVHQHESPMKMLIGDGLYVLRLLRWNVVNKLFSFGYGYRFPPVSPPQRSLIRRIKDELLSFIDVLVWRKALFVTLLSERAVKELQMLYKKKEAHSLYGCISAEMLLHEADQALVARLGLEGKRIAVSICRLAPTKRLDVMIEAFARVARDKDDLILVIGGRGPSELYLRQLAKNLQVSDKVIFAGFIDENEICDYLAMGEVSICLDWTDFDIAPYEAMAQGSKVLWTDEIETSEWLQNSGVVFPVKPTIDAVAIGLRSAFDAPKTSKLAIVQYLQQYTWDSYFNRVRLLAIEQLKG